MPPDLKDLLASGDAALPLPGRGRTAERFERLADWGRTDLVMARLAEAHTDAVAIAAELGETGVDDSRLWGVWAAQGPTALVAWVRDGEWYLTGEKPSWTDPDSGGVQPGWPRSGPAVRSGSRRR